MQQAQGTAPTPEPGNRLVWISDDRSLFDSLEDSMRAEGFTPEHRTPGRSSAVRLRGHGTMLVLEVDDPGHALSLARRIQPEGKESAPTLVISRQPAAGLLGAALRRGMLDVVAAPEPDPDLIVARLALLRRSRSEMREISLLRREMTRRLRQIRMIHRVGKTLAFALDDEDLLRTATEALRVVFHYPKTAIFLRDESSGDLVLRAQTGHPTGAMVPGFRIPPGRGLIGAALGSGEIVDVPDVTRDDRHYRVGPTAVGSELVVPFRVGGVVGGVLDLQSDEVGDFDSTDREAVETLADEIGAGLANARLYGELRGRTEEIESAYRRLRESDQLKDEFLSSISHELRTPLTSICSFSEILLEAAEEDPETIHEFVEIIHAESLRLTRLVDDLLDISKMNSGMMSWDMTEADPSSAIMRAVQSVSSLAQDQGVEVEVEIEDDLPDVPMDEDRVIQVLLNLLANAIKFSDPETTIRLRARVARPWLEIEVQDRGRGIRPEDLPRIFEKFRQGGDTLKNKPSGTGLGLAICREIVQRHGGTIRAESRPGSGSTFAFTLPLGPQVPGGAEPTASDSEVRCSGSEASPLVLVVSGSGTTGPRLVDALGTHGIRTASAAGAEEAIRRSRHETPGLIVLDILATGDAAGRPGIQLRRSPETRDVPLVLAAPTEKPGTGRAGVEATLGRPIHPGRMIETIQRILGRRPPRVLVVETEDRPRRFLSAYLERCGMHPLPAATTEDVRALGRSERPDIVILDARQPEELLRAVRSSRELADRPILLIMPEELAECPLLCGATASAVASEVARHLERAIPARPETARR